MPKPHYEIQNKIRVVTAASLFDGHDAAINIMRRMIQRSGAEVIHLGHNRSAQEVVDTAIQEDANAIALTSYQGGHVEYFQYIRKLLDESSHSHVRIFGGGGGVILPEEIKILHEAGITRIYTPDDGRKLGLQGMIDDLMEKSDFDITETTQPKAEGIFQGNSTAIAQAMSWFENHLDSDFSKDLAQSLQSKVKKSQAPVLGITGTGGAGKSSLVDELVRRFLMEFQDRRVGIISVDPSKRKTGGALLGDRIRMNSIYHPNVFMRSVATRQVNLAVSKNINTSIDVLKAAGFDLIILETSGIGQSDTEIVDHSDLSLYVMTPEYGAATQLEKIDMIDFADIIAINKFDRRGAEDALRDVKKQFQRARERFDEDPKLMPVYGTIASQFNDPGTNALFVALMEQVNEKTNASFEVKNRGDRKDSQKINIIPPERNRYLSEISETIRHYNQSVDRTAEIAGKVQALGTALEELQVEGSESRSIEKKLEELKAKLGAETLKTLENWPEKKKAYEAPEYQFQVRGKAVKVKTHSESLAGSQVPKVILPQTQSWEDLVKWIGQENVPGEFPYTGGVFPFRREHEDPTRMFAGEGSPERTNRRFHYVSEGMPAHRLSTAFDSVTLYGEDPDFRPDIYGKIGNSGVSVCCLDDAKKLYSGFDLCDPKTSVSMTINGPAPLILGFFLNAAIDQQCEKFIKEQGLEKEVEEKKKKLFEGRGVALPSYRGELPKGHNGLGLMLLGVTGDQVLPKEIYEKLKAKALSSVRGTVQADILKEDQAQNTCIFSTEFALKLMGDVQRTFVDRNVRNFYSVSISGYHIAEAGANPITQLAFTLANGFTFVEYYLSRGMDIDTFAPNLSFFFSNGVDPEYAVIGRVARRIWAKAMKLKYNASDRSQKLKYHIQTSGRSLHAQEIAFNDIRTTLQAMLALFDSCNSLHTNAYDEAITTPTEESVRRAMAIQLIINKELGLSKNQNPWQGSFIIEYLTDYVEEAVLKEFDRLTERGGVLGAMETMYQRGKIQEESLHYETLKHTGEIPIIGVNTFLSKQGSPTLLPDEVIRSTKEEKESQIQTVSSMVKGYERESQKALEALTQTALSHGNLFETILESSKVCTLGQMTDTLYRVGGQYRRNM